MEEGRKRGREGGKEGKKEGKKVRSWPGTASSHL
jgi:hypothetical protein